MTWTIPNILTVLRLVAAPGVAVMFLYFARPWADWFATILFVGAAVTDWFDGYLARTWRQESRFGAMLDPIADKAMVVIALLVITGFSAVDPLTGRNEVDPWILLPATVILFREVFVSGLREYLGNLAGTLKVTRIAKWKTMFQMVAIAVLFAKGIFEHSLIERTVGMDAEIVNGIMTGRIPDEVGLIWHFKAAWATWWSGVVLLWLAAALTLISGWDYFRKSLPFFRDEGTR